MLNNYFSPYGEISFVETTLKTFETGVSGLAAMPIADSMLNKQKEVVAILKQLQISNPAVSDVAYDILKELHKQSKDDVTISMTGDNQLLIYRAVEGGYRNLIIDEDADIIYINVTKDRRNSYNELHPFMMVNAALLASKL